MAKSTKKGAAKSKAKKPAPKKQKRGELADGAVDRVAGGAAADYFLEIDGIKGESQDNKHSPTGVLYAKWPL